MRPSLLVVVVVEYNAREFMQCIDTNALIFFSYTSVARALPLLPIEENRESTAHRFSKNSWFLFKLLSFVFDDTLVIHNQSK